MTNLKICGVILFLSTLLNYGQTHVDYSPFCSDLAQITDFCDEIYSSMLCPHTCNKPTGGDLNCGVRKYGKTIPELAGEKEENIVRRRFRRIIGGQESVQGAWPWTVLLRFNGVVKCLGAVVSKDWVLTAASCFDNDFSSHNEKDWYVVAGDHKISDTKDVEQTTGVKKIFIHPKNFKFWKIGYLNIPDDYDIALLKLKTPLKFTDHVSPVCFLNPTDQFSYSSQCRVNGWGKSQSSHLVHDIPRETRVHLVTRKECNLPNAFNGSIHHRAICGNFETLNGVKSDACNQDSGGVLSCKQNDRWKAVGIVSWGYRCGRYSPYGVFTNLKVMKTWLIETILGYSDQLNTVRSMPEALGRLTQDTREK